MTKKDLNIIKDASEKGIPIFVLTGKDAIAVDALISYKLKCIEAGCTSEHVNGVDIRIDEFITFRNEKPEMIKLPD